MTMTTPSNVQVAAPKPPAASTGRRILIIAVFVISGLVLLLSLVAVVGAWAGRSAAIELVTEFTTGVDQLAGAARNGIAKLDADVDDVRDVVGRVRDAADQAAQNVSDEGLLLTLLPPDIGAQLESLATRVRSTVDSVMMVLSAANDLVDAVRALPFVDVPQAEDVSAIQNQVQGIRTDVEQLAADVRQFRENAAAEIATVSRTASEIDARLDNTQQDLAAVDGKLAWLQDTANYIKEHFPLWMTIATVLLTALLLWVSYGMIYLMRAYGREWRGSYPERAALPALATVPEPIAPAKANAPAEGDQAAPVTLPAAKADSAETTDAVDRAAVEEASRSLAYEEEE
jgi:hypothetical protein